jgi:hypothetical protein
VARHNTIQHASNGRRLARVDRVILGKLWRWARRQHRHKSATWVKVNYFLGCGGSGWRFRGTVRDAKGIWHSVWLVQAGATPSDDM